MSTAIVTALADNPIGRLLEDLILQGGVDTSLITWVPYDGIGRRVRNGLNFTERGFGVRGAVGCSDRGNSAASQLHRGQIDWARIFDDNGTRWFHCGGIFAGLSESTAEVAEEAMTAARAAGVIVSYDLNYRPSLWSENGGSGLPADEALEYGVAHGALAMTTPGDTSMATLKAQELARVVAARVDLDGDAWWRLERFTAPIAELGSHDSHDGSVLATDTAQTAIAIRRTERSGRSRWPQRVAARLPRMSRTFRRPWPRTQSRVSRSRPALIASIGVRSEGAQSGRYEVRPRLPGRFPEGAPPNHVRGMSSLCPGEQLWHRPLLQHAETLDSLV